jgi:hypothetical protein
MLGFVYRLATPGLFFFPEGATGTDRGRTVAGKKYRTAVWPSEAPMTRLGTGTVSGPGGQKLDRDKMALNPVWASPPLERPGTGDCSSEGSHEASRNVRVTLGAGPFHGDATGGVWGTSPVPAREHRIAQVVDEAVSEMFRLYDFFISPWLGSHSFRDVTHGWMTTRGVPWP